MKNKIIKLTSVLAVCLCSNVFAVGPGAYFGLEAGSGNTQVKNSDTKKTTSNTGLAGGVFGGYQFNNFGAFEIGYTHYANGRSTNVPSCGSPVIHNDSLNLLGKGILPVGPTGVSAFVKGGFGVLQSKGGGTCTQSNKKTTRTFKPVVAIGVGYDLSQTWVADISYKRMFVNTSQVSSANIIALSIAYHWADVYCGQFLC